MFSWAGFTCKGITSNLLAGKAKFCDTIDKVKMAKSGISVEVLSEEYPFYVMALQSLSLSNMEQWQKHTKDVATH